VPWGPLSLPELSRLHEVIVRYDDAGAATAYRRYLEREVTATQTATRELTIEPATIGDALTALGEPDVLWPQGAVGDGVADDTGPVKACLAEAKRRRRARVKILGRHAVSSSVWVDGLGDVEIAGITPDAGFVEHPAYTGATTLLAIDGPTAKGAPVAVTATFRAFDLARTIPVAGTAEFTVGGYAELTIERDVSTPAAIQRGMLNRVAGKTGTALQFEELIPFSLDADDLAAARVRPVVLNHSKLVVKDLTLTGRSKTAMTGLRVFHYAAPILHNIRTSGFLNAGVACEDWWGGSATKISDTGSGQVISPSGQGLRANLLTDAALDEWHSDRAQGMAITHRQLANCRIGRVVITSPQGRGYYLYGSSGSVIGFVLVKGAGATGVSIVYGSSHNRLVDAVSLDCAHQGFWSNGRKNQDNEVAALLAEGSGVAPDVSISASDTGARLHLVDAGTVGVLPDTIINRGTATALRARVAAMGF
jgi:hypothetical protein